MIKIRKYTLKNKHKKRFTGGSDNNRNLNRKQRRLLNRDFLNYKQQFAVVYQIIHLHQVLIRPFYLNHKP